jgi:hypothetical protein
LFGIERIPFPAVFDEGFLVGTFDDALRFCFRAFLALVVSSFLATDAFVADFFLPELLFELGMRTSFVHQMCNRARV